ncbi:hypothetical protein [Streptomyces sp. YS-3]|uniref:hypothetical protein n=1 Tax=Streptomyces sp. YS-3 TaxID=3381352 RepID=UPI0038629F40
MSRSARTGSRQRASNPRWPAFARRYGLDIEHPVQLEVEALGRTNSSAWSSPPSTRTSTATSSPGRSLEEQQRRALEDFAGRWGAEADE